MRCYQCLGSGLLDIMWHALEACTCIARSTHGRLRCCQLGLVSIGLAEGLAGDATSYAFGKLAMPTITHAVQMGSCLQPSQ